MSDSQTEAQVLVLSKSDVMKQVVCCCVIYGLWVLNIFLTAWNIRSYYVVLSIHRNCWHCFFAYYMLVTIGVECFTFLVLVITIPLVVFRRAENIRVYVTVLFLTIYLELMLAVVLAQEYQAIGDVMRMWKTNRNLQFFEVNYKCCGVLGPGDYTVIGGTPPNSCYKDGSGESKDLYSTGCSTVSVKPTAMSFSVIIALIFKILMLAALVIYLILLRQTKTPMRKWTWLHPPVRVETQA
ncbi:hypothetical protein KR032_004659 [Drosophila birchii]|nr:hypothetical protein KR032_004659 [Drosophila birchii]